MSLTAMTVDDLLEAYLWWHEEAARTFHKADSDHAKAFRDELNRREQERVALVVEMEQIRKHHQELVSRLLNTFAQEIVDHDGPATLEGQTWQDEYLEFCREMLTWMQREQGQ